jgi:hypothetical protein
MFGSTRDLTQEEEDRIVSRVVSYVDLEVKQRELLRAQRLASEPDPQYVRMKDAHEASLKYLDKAIKRLGDQMQLLLLEDGRQIVDVPAHMEIQKAPKGK